MSNLSANQVNLIKHRARCAAMNIVKSSTNDDNLIEAISNLLWINQEMYSMLEKVLTEYKEMLGISPEIDEIEQLLAKARGEACHN